MKNFSSDFMAQNPRGSSKFISSDQKETSGDIWGIPVSRNMGNQLTTIKKVYSDVGKTFKTFHTVELYSINSKSSFRFRKGT